jgi:hypothetical protein
LPRGSFIGVCGDVHGHLQLALASWAIEQRDSGRELEAILLCGDVGTFVDRLELDAATIRHGRVNPCELEFLDWSAQPPPPWLDGIFADEAKGGLGLRAPVIMVHGNHEGFDHLASAVDAAGPAPAAPTPPADLPAVDSAGRIRLLPSGWRVRTRSGIVVGGIGGIQLGQRLAAGYPDMAYIDAAAVARLGAADELDVLITHQGPARVQGISSGAEALDVLLDRARPCVWFHGHSRRRREPIRIGSTDVVPLGDATFDPRRGWRVATDAWHEAWHDGTTVKHRARMPNGVREMPHSAWARTADGRLVAPHLVRFIPRTSETSP